jgi:hypothetical protein
MISAQKVNEFILDSLFKDEEVVDGQIPANAVLVEGIKMKIGFHKERLESHREEIKQFLNCLPEKFHLAGGGGASFLEAPMDKDGHHWGEHESVDELFMLGQGLGYVKCLLPRNLWNSLPGGMPYYQINLEFRHQGENNDHKSSTF